MGGSLALSLVHKPICIKRLSLYLPKQKITPNERNSKRY